MSMGNSVLNKGAVSIMPTQHPNMDIQFILDKLLKEGLDHDVVERYVQNSLARMQPVALPTIESIVE